MGRTKQTSRSVHHRACKNRGILNTRSIFTKTCGHGKKPTKKSTRITAAKKQYDNYHDPIKRKINHLYAETVRRILGPSACHIILDAIECITSRTLVEYGFSKKRICAPNINEKECKALNKFGVNSPHTSIEKSLSNPYLWEWTASEIPNAFWYDSMTTVGGRAQYSHYIGLAADRFLLQNRTTIGKSCILAITFSVHNNQAEWTYGSGMQTMLKQIKRLAALRGFKSKVIGGPISYNRSMRFIMWHMIYDPESVRSNHKKLMMWLGSVDHIIGFPPGYEV
jgi:hypothetical protein